MMTNKINLVGSGNNEKRTFYIFKKDRNFFKIFPDLLEKLGFGLISEAIKEKYQSQEDKIWELKSYLDNFINEKFDIDLIIASNRIILIIRSDPKNRTFLVDVIKSYLL